MTSNADGEAEQASKRRQRHPAAWSVDDLSKQVKITFRRDRGPGGQHRNKVETGVVLCFEPLGIEASASERRSQAENRRLAEQRLRVELALQHRHAAAPTLSPLWLRRVRSQKITVNPQHQDFPALLAEALDQLVAHDWQLAEVGHRMGISSTQLVKLLKLEPRALAMLNCELVARGQRPRQ